MYNDNLLDRKHRYNFQFISSKQRNPSAHYTGWSILAQHARRPYRTLEYFTGCPQVREGCRKKCTGRKIKQTTEVWWEKEDCYFKKAERFELNMTGLHFVHACATSSAEEQNNLYQDSRKRQITSCNAGVFTSVPELKNLRTQKQNLAPLICK